MPEALATVTVPEDLTTLDDDELATLLDELNAEFDRLHAEGSRDIPVLTGLADNIDAVTAEQKGREAAAAEAEAEIEKLVNRVHPTDAASDPADPDAETDDDDDDDDDTDDTDTADPKAKEKELVTASAKPPARKPPLANVARRSPRPRIEHTHQPQVVITAAADVPGIPSESRMDTLRMATAFHDKARGLNDGSPRAPIARITIPHQTVDLGTDAAENARLIQEVVGERTAEALVASGGWCAPSTPLFALFDIGPDTADLFDLPSIGAPVRGGIMVPSYYGFGDVAGALWNWTEAQDIAAATQPAGPDKPCLKIPCPTWTECRLEAEGLCVTHGNLSDRAWPELTRYFINIVMAAHMHRISAAKLAKVVSGATAVVPDASMLTSDAAGDLLGVLELQAADLRSQYRLARTRAVDAIVPDWTAAILRANMAKRAGVDFMQVTDAQVTSWLTSRGVRPQFVSDYQPLYSTAPATKWPAALEFTMLIAGSYVSIDGGTIDLGVVRDSILNSTNDFTAAWSEQFFQVCNIGPKARKVSVTLTPDGVTACCP
jgi:hypothetical protein